MQFEKLKIYGVSGLNSSKNLVRTDDAVGLTYNKESNGSPPHTFTSDFDTCYPWCDMQEVHLNGSVFIKIPKFYAKYTKISGMIDSYKCQISGCRYEGFSTLFIDGKGNEIDYVLVGKYPGTTGLSSDNTKLVSQVNGAIPPSYSDIALARQKCSANGPGFQNYDFLINEIIKLLFTVEFATTDLYSIFIINSKDRIGTVGHTTELPTPSGSTMESDSQVIHMKYRGIEDLFGRNYDYLCDGMITDSSNHLRCCTYPPLYNDSTSYFNVGKLSGAYGGYITKMAPSNVLPLILLTVDAPSTDAGGAFASKANFYPNSYGTPLHAGGSGNLWSQSMFGAGSSVYSGLARLCYKPIEG